MRSQDVGRWGFDPRGHDALAAAKQAERDYNRAQAAQDQADTDNNIRIAMSKFKTQFGDSVTTPASFDPVEAALDGLFELTNDALDLVTDAARREVERSQSSAVDRKRFPEQATRPNFEVK